MFEAVEALRVAVDGLLRAAATSNFSDDEVLDVLRDVEVQNRRLTAVDHLLVAAVDGRGIARERGYKATPELLVELLRVDVSEGRARVRAAQELGPRRELSGAALHALFECVAAASKEGAISSPHARIVTSTIDALPPAVQAEVDTQVELFLVEQARLFDPRTLRVIAMRLTETLNPDGKYTDEAARRRGRDLTVRQRADGSAYLCGELDALCAEALLTVLDSTARPAPATDGQRDPRSPGQRRHDGLSAALALTLRSGQLPVCGGVSTTILITMTAEQAESGDGLARTGHGALIPVRTALTLAGDSQLQAIQLGPLKQIEAYGHTQRLFTQGQRLAMISRDQGCSFPACTIPPAWCEAAHIVDFAKGGPTRVDNGTLLCGYHHREYERLGWRCALIDGVPMWTPPRWIDAAQKPRRNHAHEPRLEPGLEPVGADPPMLSR